MKKKTDFEKMNGSSLDQQKELLELLKMKAPEIFTENKVDMRQLKATLGEDVIADAERYGLNWSGKMDCFRTIQETTTSTLKPVRDESVDFDKSENLFIEGDNLQVLKVLQKSYYGKVKMIYIDPPYNTGNDFIYNDKFAQNKREYLEEIGAIDKDGNVLNASLYKQNTKDSGHYHSDWLNMMYPRLFLARNLLRQDGVIFVSIDDNEVHNLRMIMDEIFGEDNFVSEFIWKSRQQKDNRNITGVSIDHEYIVCYSRSSGDRTVRGDERKTEQYSNPDHDPRGPWTSGNMVGLLPQDQRPNCHYDLIDPESGVNYGKPKMGWRYEKATIMRLIEEDRILWPSEEAGRPRKKVFLNELNGEYTNTSSVLGEGIYTKQGTSEMSELFKEKIFDFPKPTRLIKELIKQGSSKEDSELILDFFAGSGTTAHAVMQLNAEDGGSRKWICVQLPEACKEGTEAQKAGYKTIADIAKERIRRAGKKIKEENPDAEVDLGFKAFKLDESNFKIWNTQVESVEQLEQQMMEMFDNVIDGASTEAMLYELILKSGKELNIPISEMESGGEKFFKVNDGSLVICLSEKMSTELFKGILAEEPKKIVLLDKAFGEDDQLKTNLLLQAEGVGVDEVRVI